MRMKTLSTDMPVEMGYCGPPDPESCSSLTCLRSLRRMQLSNPKVVVSTRFELAWQRVDILHAKYEREAGFHFLIADTPFRADVNRSLEITWQCQCQQWRVEARCITGGRQLRQAPPGPFTQRCAFYYYI
ncbi:hypothetical protein ACFX15_038551 [Malus domestica]